MTSERFSRLFVLVFSLRLAACGSDELSAPSGSGGDGASSGASSTGGGSGGASSTGASTSSGGNSSDGGRVNDGGAATETGGSGGASIDGEGGDSAAGAPAGGAATTGGAANSGGRAGKASGGTAGTGNGGAPSDAGADSGGTGGADDGSCTKATECSTATEICDPGTQTCAPFQCTATLACAAGQICLGQGASTAGGACYTGCVPFGLACAGSRECVDVTFDGSQGVCLGRGSGAVNTTCDPTSATNTGCVANHVCITEGATSTCRRKCNFFAASPGCPANTFCNVGGYCSVAAVDGAPVGTACSVASGAGAYCGREAGGNRGLCVEDGQGIGCYRYCRSNDADCGGGAWQCVGAFAQVPELGLCVDRGTCGDGGAGEHASCEACVDVENEGCCEAAFAECRLGSPCEILNECLNGCAVGNQACIDVCAQATPDGIAPYLAYTRCLFGDTAQGFSGACSSVCE